MTARTIVLRGIAVVGLLTFATASAQAQKRPQFEATIGGVLMTGYSLGSLDANLTANQTAGGPYTLFKSSTKMNAGGGLDARLGWRATRMLTVEGGLTWARPQLATALTSDVESAANVTATENISQYIVEAAVIAALTSRERALVPFVRGGFGYLRELHDGNSLAETGQSIHLGGGFTYWFGNIARQSLGLRVDGRYYLLHKGLNLGKTNRSLGAFSGGVVFGF